ncbi:unnamed protein product [Umbelopsis vinacea]
MSSNLKRRPYALIAIAGADTKIHILSLANSEELCILSGHTKTITDIRAHPQNDRHVWSTTKDGTVRLWDVEEARCLAIYQADVTVSIFHPFGTTFITAGARADFRAWQVVGLDNTSCDPIHVEKKQSRFLKKMRNDSQIDCIRYVDGNLLSKSVNGGMEYCDPATERASDQSVSKLVKAFHGLMSA